MTERPIIVMLASKSVGVAMTRAVMRQNQADVVVITIDDGRDTRTRLGDFVDLEAEGSCRLLVASNATEAYSHLQQARPALVIVAGWYRLIPEAVLRIAPRGFFGLHFSDLPRYRGFAPVVWAMLNGEPTIGFSLFRLGHGVDEGDLAGRGTVPVRDRAIGEVLIDLEDASSACLADVLPKLLDGSVELEPQPTIKPSYCGARLPSDGQIDWTQPAEVVSRFVRAQSRPYPGAFADHDGGRIWIWAAELDSSATYHGLPGQVVRIDRGKPIVCCGDGLGLRLVEIEAFNDDRNPTTQSFPLGSFRFSSASGDRHM